MFDTDAVIEMLQKRRYMAGAISVITLIEVLRGIEAEKRHRVKELLNESFDILNINNQVIETYCTIYRGLKERGVVVPDADILIAATAISNNMVLKSRDKHFQALKKFGLKMA